MHQWIFQLLSILFQMMTLSRNDRLLYLYQVFRWMTSFRWWRQNRRAFEQCRRVLSDNKLLFGQSLRWMTSRLWIHGNLRFVLRHKIDYLPWVKYACQRKKVACLHLSNGLYSQGHHNDWKLHKFLLVGGSLPFGWSIFWLSMLLITFVKVRTASIAIYITVFIFNSAILMNMNCMFGSGLWNLRFGLPIYFCPKKSAQKWGQE